MFADWIFFGLAGVALFVFRHRAPDPTGGFRMPGWPWIPALFVSAAAYAVISSVASNPGNAAIGTLLIALGVPVYGIWRRHRRGA